MRHPGKKSMNVTFTTGIPGPRENLPVKLPGRANTPRATSYWGTLASVAIDAASVFLSGLVAYRLRFPGMTVVDVTNILFDPSPGAQKGYLGFLVLHVAVLILVALSQNLYSTSPSDSRVYMAFLVARCAIIATLLVTAFIYISSNNSIPRLAVVFTVV